MPVVRLILASSSPRRHQILTDANFLFEIVVPGDDAEDGLILPDDTPPENFAILKAEAKAKAVCDLISANNESPCLVLGADTIAALGTGILGKPKDRADAVQILSDLSGTQHRVITGMSIIGMGLPGANDLQFQQAVSTQVTMCQMSKEDIQAYVDSGEADGKAGAYAVQETGDRYIEKIEGSFANVVGFPIEAFEECLPKLWSDWKISGSWKQLKSNS